MKLKMNATPDDAMPLIQRVRDWAVDADWSDVRVRIDLPEDRSRLVSVARVAEAATVLFVRAIPVDVDEPLPACTDVINEELVEKAQKMFEEK